MAAPSKKVVELFVGRIPWTLSNKELHQYFGAFGKVEKCWMPVNTATGFFKGYCWITFNSKESLAKALEHTPHVIDGAVLRVQKNQKAFDRELDSDED